MPDEPQDQDGWQSPVDEEQVEEATDQATELLMRLTRPLVRKALRRVIVVSKRVEDYVREVWEE